MKALQTFHYALLNQTGIEFFIIKLGRYSQNLSEANNCLYVPKGFPPNKKCARLICNLYIERTNILKAGNTGLPATFYSIILPICFLPNFRLRTHNPISLHCAGESETALLISLKACSIIALFKSKINTYSNNRVFKASVSIAKLMTFLWFTHFICKQIVLPTFPSNLFFLQLLGFTCVKLKLKFSLNSRRINTSRAMDFLVFYVIQLLLHVHCCGHN